MRGEWPTRPGACRMPWRPRRWRLPASSSCRPGRPGGGGRARSGQPARDHRGDRARAGQQRAAGQPARRGRRRAGRSEPTLPRHPQDPRPAARARGPSAVHPGADVQPADHDRGILWRGRASTSTSPCAPERRPSRSRSCSDARAQACFRQLDRQRSQVRPRPGPHRRAPRAGKSWRSGSKTTAPDFSPEVLELLGEPYISTRHRSGGLGLGVFIAETLLARTGATLQFGNLEAGARVVDQMEPRRIWRNLRRSR